MVLHGTTGGPRPRLVFLSVGRLEPPPSRGECGNRGVIDAMTGNELGAGRNSAEVNRRFHRSRIGSNGMPSSNVVANHEFLVWRDDQIDTNRLLPYYTPARHGVATLRAVDGYLAGRGLHTAAVINVTATINRRHTGS